MPGVSLVQKGSLNAELLSGVQTAEVVLWVVFEFDKSFAPLLAHPHTVAPCCFSRVDPSGGSKRVPHCAPLSSHAERPGILGLRASPSCSAAFLQQNHFLLSLAVKEVHNCCVQLPQAPLLGVVSCPCVTWCHCTPARVPGLGHCC